MLADYSGVFLGVGLAVAAWLVALGMRARHASDHGAPPPVPGRVGVGFHRLALAIALVTAALGLLLPWAVVLRELGWPALGSLLAIAVPVGVGLFHGLRTGAFDW